MQYTKAIEGALITALYHHQHSNLLTTFEIQSPIFHQERFQTAPCSSNDEDTNSCPCSSPSPPGQSLHRRHDLLRDRYIITHQNHPPCPIPLHLLTHPGLGSCGYTNSDSDAIVALSTEIMANGANPNNNPKCGTSINIYNPATGTTHSATIVDTCEGCSKYDIDVSPSVFKAVDPNGLGDGRITVDVRRFSELLLFSSPFLSKHCLLLISLCTMKDADSEMC